jgi:hypothetical protein
MAIILWGKPIFTVTAVGGAAADQSANLTIPTPVADSTQLTTDAGDEHTADIEGGGYEARRFDKNTYTLEFTVRFADGRTMPFEDKSHDGNVTGTYKFKVTSDETGAPSMTMQEATVRYEDEYNADDGARRHYYAQSLVPASGDQIVWSHSTGSGS